MRSGRSVQNGFHEIIGDTPEQRLALSARATNRRSISWAAASGARISAPFADGALNAQILPQITAQAGNTEIYVQAGAILRIGQGLDSDFGPSLIQPGISGMDAYTPTRPLVWYVFGGAVGRLVAHDIFIQGNDFQSSRGVALDPDAGAIWRSAARSSLHGLRVTATEVLETPRIPWLRAGVPIWQRRDFGGFKGRGFAPPQFTNR